MLVITRTIFRLAAFPHFSQRAVFLPVAVFAVLAGLAALLIPP
jgi:hypothetical protein